MIGSEGLSCRMLQPASIAEPHKSITTSRNLRIILPPPLRLSQTPVHTSGWSARANRINH
jgi:hypothetical protein